MIQIKLSSKLLIVESNANSNNAKILIIHIFIYPIQLCKQKLKTNINNFQL